MPMAHIADALPVARRGLMIRAAQGIAVSLLTPLLVVLAFDPFGLWVLIFVAFVPMVVAQHRLMPAALSGLAPGIGIAGLFATRMSAGLADGDVAWYYQLWPLYVALLVWALSQSGRAFHERSACRWFVVSFPAAWVGIDFLRNLSGVDFLAATWGNPAYALYSQPWLLQPLSITGVFGLQLLVLLVNFAVALAVCCAVDRRRSGIVAPDLERRAARGLRAVAALVAGWILLSLFLLDAAEPAVRVATVMPVSPLDPEEELRRDIAETRHAAQQGAQLVVWREGGLKFDPRQSHTDVLTGLAREHDLHLVVGYRYQSGRGHHNEALLITPTGEFLGPYGKSHPGTFAGDFSDTGGSYQVFDTDIGRLATIICYDLDFTDTARRMAALGANLVAVPSADVPGIARSHYTHLVFRAIENRIAMAKADNAFDSAIIDPWGRIIASAINPLQAGDFDRSHPPRLLVADVPVVDVRTLYTRLGDWVGWLALLTTLVVFLSAAFQRFRHHSIQGGD